MKMIYISKNILNQEFQHFLELRLIEVMIHKMLAIQFMSNVHLIQIRLKSVTLKMNILVGTSATGDSSTVDRDGQKVGGEYRNICRSAMEGEIEWGG
jgi:hypothetical protein